MLTNRRLVLGRGAGAGRVLRVGQRPCVGRLMLLLTLRVELRRVDLRCVNLRCVELRCAELRVNLRRAELRCAELRCAELCLACALWRVRSLLSSSARGSRRWLG